MTADSDSRGEIPSRKVNAMSADKTKTNPNGGPAKASKAMEGSPQSESKPDSVNSGSTELSKPDTTPAKRGMGEGQKPVTQAYKDNWNAIFGNKLKTRKR